MWRAAIDIGNKYNAFSGHNCNVLGCNINKSAAFDVYIGSNSIPSLPREYPIADPLYRCNGFICWHNSDKVYLFGKIIDFDDSNFMLIQIFDINGELCNRYIKCVMCYFNRNNSITKVFGCVNELREYLVMFLVCVFMCVVCCK